MARCLVNERPELTEIRPETWEGLLAALDARLAADRLVVTAVRFDGVDQPSFRGPAVGATPLDGIAQVDIDAEDAVGLLFEGFYPDLPADIPAGTYRLGVGLYALDSGQRLHLTSAGSTGEQDAVLLEQVVRVY